MSDIKNIYTLSFEYKEEAMKVYRTKIEEYKSILLETLSLRYNTKQYIMELLPDDSKKYYRISGFGVDSFEFDKLYPYLEGQRIYKNMRESDRSCRLSFPNNETRFIVDYKEVESVQGHKRKW